MMKRLFVIAASLFFLAACNPFDSLKLQQSDIDQYIRAYEEIAKAPPKLKEQRSAEKAISVLTCNSCRDTLRGAVKQAGYKGISDFLLADARIVITTNYAIQAKIAALIGDAAGEVYTEIPLELACAGVSQSDKPEDQELKRYCQYATSLGVYIDKLGDTVRDAAKKLMQIGDFELLLSNLDAIRAATTNPDLIDEFNQSYGGDWDD